MSDCIIQEQKIPEELLGQFRDSSDIANNSEAMQERFAEDGYLFLQGVLDVEEVLAAREEVFTRLIDVGEIEPPALEGIFTGTSKREELVDDLGEFWQSVSEGTALRRVSHGAGIQVVVDRLYGEPTHPHDYIFLRPGVVSRATHLHFDRPFFARGSDHIVTVWTALGDIPVSEGPLMVLEGSHRFADLIEPMKEIDYDTSDTPLVQMTDDAVAFARARGSRFLTADFRAGDVIIFSMTLMHGSLDNYSPIGRTRLSCDVRWQPKSDPIDARYQGPNPAGTTGAGYGELNGAKPLTVNWHKR